MAVLSQQLIRGGNGVKVEIGQLTMLQLKADLFQHLIQAFPISVFVAEGNI